MAKKQAKNDYFAMFIKQAEYSQQAAQRVGHLLSDFDPFRLPEALREVHIIEQEADAVSLQIMQALAKEFLPPIEREDIVLLTHELDNVTDEVEDILRHVYMFNLTQIKTHALEFCNVVERLCEVLINVMREFRHFAKSKIIWGLIQEVSKLEEEGDRLFTEGMRELFTQTTDPKALLIWSGIYRAFEDCCDSCEHAADAVENAIMKNM